LHVVPAVINQNFETGSP